MPIHPEVRIAQSGTDIDRFGEETEDWFDRASRRDVLHKYATQLADLKTIVDEGIARLRGRLGGIPGDADCGEVYRNCRELDRGLVLVRKVWSYYREKYDQRDDPRLGPTLNAADEVVWSAYSLPFRNLGQPLSSAPLPYIAPIEAPGAVPRLEPPAEFRDASDALKDWLKKLPIPVIGLSPSCVEEPWRLVQVGHEVGHHVLLDLLPNWELLGRFRALLVQEEGFESWGGWGVEVFADAWGLFTMGPWSIWAVADLEMDGEVGLLTAKSGRTKYPAPLVRLGVLAELAEALGVPARARLLDDFGLDFEAMARGRPILDPTGNRDLRSEAAGELARAGRIAKVLRSELHESLGTFEDLTGWALNGVAYQPGGAVEVWAGKWINGAPRPIDAEPQTVRQLTSSAVAAWAAAAVGDDPALRETVRANLVGSFASTIVGAREDGVRADWIEPDRGAGGLGAELVEFVLGDGPEAPRE